MTRQGRHDAAGAPPSGADELRVGAEAYPRRAVDAVAGREPRRPGAHGLHHAGELLAEDPRAGLEHAERQPYGEPDPGGELEPADLAVRA
jgi:hypothetical protein